MVSFTITNIRDICRIARTNRGKNASTVSVLQRADAHIPFEVLAKEGGTGEVERVGNLLHGHVRGLQLGLDVHQHHAGDDVQQVPAGDLLHGGAEVLQGDAQPVGIELGAPFTGVVLDDQLDEFPVDFLLPVLGRLLLAWLDVVEDVHLLQEALQYLLGHPGAGRVGARGDTCQQGEIVFDVGSDGFVQGDDRILQQDGEAGEGGLDEVDPRDALGGEADESHADFLLLSVELDDGARQ